MRREDIACLFCLSCFLFFFYVNSQKSCPVGWFGSECKYKCRCTDDKCDPSGACVDSYTCQGGWFGPACQYADLAYNTPGKEVFTDGKDSTCGSAIGVDLFIIQLNETFMFTWLRVRVIGPAYGALSKLQLTLSHDELLVDCLELKTQVLDSRTLDMHCNSEDDINKITLNGEAVSELCSVYVSGGRNVALKEKAVQGRTYWKVEAGVNTSYGAELAVDGNTHQNFSYKSCARTYNATTWSLYLSKPRSVHRYVFYNRDDRSMNRFIGFTLEGLNQENESIFEYTDTSQEARVSYTIIHLPATVQTVLLTVNNTENILSICEFEVYGDAICESGQFGFECEKSCNCLNGEVCFVNTGGCPSGCPVGFGGEACQTSCKVGMFGAHCNLSCSQYCKPTGGPNATSCNVSTGDCLNGCQPGFIGSRCVDSETGLFTLELIVGTCALLASLLFFAYCCYPFKDVKPKEETYQVVVAGPTPSDAPAGL
ncbi:hypothetical protein BsWGS_24538 [Bradybaena similaris]